MRLFKKSAIIFGSNQASKFASIVVKLILVGLLSKESLGLYLQVFLVFQFVTVVMDLQLGSSFYYYVSTLGPDRRRGFIMQSLIMALAEGALIAGVLYLGAPLIGHYISDQPGELTGLLQIFSLYIFGHLVVTLVGPYLISLDHPLRSGAYSAITHVGQGVLAVVLFASGASIAQVLWAEVIWISVCGGWGLMEIVVRLPGGSWRPQGRLIRDQLVYCWPLFLTTTIAVINRRYDQMLISGYLGTGDFTDYNLGASGLPFLSGLTASVAAALMPDLARLGERGEHDKAFQLWRGAANKVALVIFPVFAFLLFNCREAVIILFGQIYAKAAWPFGIYLLILPVQIAVASALLKSFGQTRPVAVSAGLALVTNVVLSTTLLLLGRGGLLSFIGPAIGTVISGFVLMGYLFVRIGRSVGVSFSQVLHWGYLARFLLVTMACSAVTLLVQLPAFTDIERVQVGVEFLLRGVIFLSLWLCVVWFLQVLKKEEMHYFLLPLTVSKRVVRWARGVPACKRE